MKVVLREDNSGISEVVGTILILAMTVVLFSTIIIWVTSIPTPVAQTRVDIVGSLTPVYSPTGTQLGDWINMTHQGGESLPAASTLIYIVDQPPGGGASKTDIARLRPFDWVGAPLVGGHGTEYGLRDGTGTAWDLGERYSYYSSNLSVSDTITVTVVDISRGLVVWTSQMTPTVGTRPPVFLNVWASSTLYSTPSTPVSGASMFLFANVMDPDGYGNIKSVTANVTAITSPTSLCHGWLPMLDNGQYPDQGAGDGIFTLGRSSCLNAQIGWDGTLVLFNATDAQGHVTTTRLTLHIVPGTNQGGTGPQNTTGRPPYLQWNGNQGYNIFSLVQWNLWTTQGIQPQPQRTFKPNETVVVVVGSLTLQDVFSADTFNLLDPFSGSPQQAVVYGSSKTVNLATVPSSQQAFGFYQFVNGYYLYTYQFILNPASGTANYYTFATAPHPPYYYFARYPLSMYLKASSGTVFSATDSINITSPTGAYQQFPQITTYSDPGFTQPSATFRSTSTMYVKVSMLSADSIVSNVNMGNVFIEDFSGGTELWRAPISGYQANLPICPISGSCSAPTPALTPTVSPASYEFAVNLSRVNQNPWIPGTQYYSFGLTSIHDSDETYGTVSVQVQIAAPLYKMDVVAGTQGSSSNAWGTSNYLYYYQNYNGYDFWKSLRVDWCSGTGTSTSGIPGTGTTCPSPSYVSGQFGNFFADGTLGIAEAMSSSKGDAMVIYRHTVDATGSVVYLPVFYAYDFGPVKLLPEACSAVAVGDVTGVGVQSVICGGADGKVWYYSNNGNWSLVYVDQTGIVNGTSHSITSISVGDFNGDGWLDIAVTGTTGFVAWYPNLGHGVFQNPGIGTNQPAVSEYNVYGAPVGGTNYLNTYPSATSPEILREQILSVPQVSNTNPNTGFDTQGNWTAGTIQSPATMTYQSPGGNPGGYIQVLTGATVSALTPAGYWQEPFTTSGSQPFTANVSLDYELTANGAVGTTGVSLRAYIESAAGAPSTAPVWSVTYASGATVGWTHVTPQLIPETSLPQPGTYYVKVAMFTTCSPSCIVASTAGFDNVVVSWASYAGNTSALQHYWYFGTMPTNPLITFSLVLKAQSAYSTDSDNFTFAYSTNVVGSNPTSGTYTPLYPPYVAQTTNVTVSPLSSPDVNVTLPTSIQAKGVWIRVTDTNRVVGKTVLDNLTVSRLYIFTYTPKNPTVQKLTGPATTSTVTSSNAGDTDNNGVSDLVVGTTGGKVWLYLGFSPVGLQSPTTPVYTGSGAIVSVKFGSIRGNVTKYGLQVVAATGTNVYFIDPVLKTTFGNAIAVPSGQGPITAMGVGDVNGDGVDDVVVGTGGGSGSNTYGYVLFYANFGSGYSWSPSVLIYNTGGLVYYNLAVGDAANSLYMGR